MILRIPLKELVAQLPGIPAPPPIAHPDKSLKAGGEQPDFYIWPDVKSEEEIANKKVILITAAGAMGKSMAANAVASKLNALVVDLSKVRVGSDSLTGLLTRVLGWEEAPKFIGQVEAGLASLILDGLDEAQLAAGREHYNAFLKNVADFVRGGGNRGQILMFGRRDVVDTTYLELNELGIDSCITEISPLTYGQAKDLINEALDRRVSRGLLYDMHRTHPVPFSKLRDEVLLGMARALGGDGDEIEKIWPIFADFLGYPPVLLVLSEHLAVDNFAHSSGERFGVKASRAKAQRGLILQRIVEGILDRESLKARTQLAKVVALNDKEISLLYGREEQLLRVLGFMGGADLDVLPPAILSANDRQVYDDHIRMFMPDHPFVSNRMFANTVFSDYLRAYLATAPLSGAFGVQRPQLVASCPAPGPFYAYFSHALALELESLDGDAGQGRIGPKLSEDYIDDVIKSHVASCTYQHYVIIRWFGQTAHMFLYETESRSDGFLSFISFEIEESSGILELTSPVSRCSIITDHGVVISARNSDIEIGPDVFLVADELELHGETLTALADDSRGAAVLLVASKPAVHDADLKVNSYPGSALWVNWPEVWPQWRKYYQNPSGRPGFDAGKSTQALVGLRRILRAFHKGVGEHPTIYSEMLDRLVVGDSQILGAVLAALLDVEIVFLEQGQYKLNLDKLKSYSISWAAINGPDFANTLHKLFSELCNDSRLSQLLKAQHPGG
ncbi:hypothetical protein [Micromonospora parva]|uniref:hypothetical protein n=1 Tax=Micromonospora parva TaxID=1464048 RepID=UPI0033D7FBCF